MKACIACAEEIQEAAKLCRFCGTEQSDQRFLVSQVNNAEQAVQETNEGAKKTSVDSAGPTSDASRKSTVRTAIIASVAIAAVLGTIVGSISLSNTSVNGEATEQSGRGDANPRSSSPEITREPEVPRTLWAAIAIQESVFLSNSDWVNCTELEEVLSESPFDGDTLARIDDLKEPMANDYNESIRRSQDFVKSNPWVSDLSNSTGTNPNLLEFSQPVFIALLSESGLVDVGEITLSSPTIFSRWSVDFARALVDGCGLSRKLSLQERQIALAKSVVDRALTQPIGSLAAGWWPESFTSYFLDTDLAFKWADRRCSGSGVCWHLDVVSRYGCSSLYAEISISDSSGNLVDWSNDSARGLKSGQVAELEFRSFEDGSLSGRIIELNCRS